MIVYTLIYLLMIYSAISITLMLIWGHNHKKTLCSFSIYEFCRRYIMSLLFGPIIYIPRSYCIYKSMRLSKAGKNLMIEGINVTNYMKNQTEVTKDLTIKVNKYHKKYLKYIDDSKHTLSSLRNCNDKWNNFVKYHYI